ncbi:MAG: ABC transporter ATP-binding protein [Planctomycetes bacterium]|nr:ABC transporter ATP-binding protein [Planctomycetota bacterium]
MADRPLLEARNLRTYFRTREGIARAVDGVSFTLARGETLGLVGESGCGKSVTALTLMQLVPEPAGYLAGGEIVLDGDNLVLFTPRQKREMRGKRMAMVFQDPMTALNPVFTIGSQIVETIRQHRKATRHEARRRAIEMLERVGIPLPEQRFGEYSYQLSGGMQQRAMIAMALCCQPDILIADEPTTALDVTIQAQILDLLRALQKEFGMAILLITHNLGVVAEMAHRVSVMYAGKIVESAPVDALFRQPKHPYTIGLFGSLPSRNWRGRRLRAIPGIVPPATQFPSGCRFCTRCEKAMDVCRREEPALKAVATSHETACFLYP